MNHIGLFAGIGGFELAARWAGWNTVAWCEIDPFCQTVLSHHFPNAKKHGDIKRTDFSGYAGQIDILTGGFPCQPYSLAGKRLGNEDERHLWPEMLRAIRETKPRWIVGENVLGLINWNGGLVFNEVQADLEAEGYEVQTFVLPAASVGAPHQRYRVWIVAHADRKPIEQENNRWKEYKQKNGSEIRPFNRAGGKATAHADRQRCKERDTSSQSSHTGRAGRRMPKGRFEWPTESPVCRPNDGIPAGLVGITVSKHREESLKGYGNAIVPQLALQIFQAINQYENA